MSQPDFYAILDECLARLCQGESPADCLADYPEQAAALDPTLALTAELMHLPRLEPAPEQLAQGYEAVMAAVAAQERPSWLNGTKLVIRNRVFPRHNVPTGAWSQKLGFSFALRAIMLFVVVLIASAALVITASADSLPGDRLYPVKRSWENTRLALTLAEPSRQALESDFAEQRREEVQAVLELRRPVIVEFQGRLQATNDDVWLVSGLSVELRNDSVVSGSFSVGQQIFVRAQAQQDGKLVALRIVGNGPGLPDPITPSHTPQPTPTPTPRPTHEATATDEPTRRPTPEPTHRPTDVPTATHEPTRQPTATHQPEPTDSLIDRATPTPEPRPTEPPSDKPTPTPKPRDKPTATHEPTREATATRKSEPTATHEPKPTATHEPEPTATHEPEPTATREAEPMPTPTSATDSGRGSDRPP